MEFLAVNNFDSHIHVQHWFPWDLDNDIISLVKLEKKDSIIEKQLPRRTMKYTKCISYPPPAPLYKSNT